MTTEAILTSDKQYTSFIYDGLRVRFMTSPRLERYTKVLKWDHGYLEVMAKYQGSTEEEEYIDLLPILKNLNIDPESYLANIKTIRIVYD